MADIKKHITIITYNSETRLRLLLILTVDAVEHMLYRA